MMKMMKSKMAKMIFSIFIGMFSGFMMFFPATAQLPALPVNVVGDFSPTTFQQIQLMAQQLGTQTTLTATANTSKLAQAKEFIETAKRWTETVEQHTQKMIGDLKRFTSMRNLLKNAEQNLGLSTDTLKALADVGELIRGSFTLKNQFTSLIRTRLSMIRSLEQRARNGIFNPQADLEDIESYLRYSIGRDAAHRVATLEKLRESDPLLEQLYYQLEKIRAEKAALVKELDGVREKLEKEASFSDAVREIVVDDNGQTQTNANGRSSLSPQAIQTLTLRRGQLEQQIADLTTREDALLKEIQERYALIQGKFDNAYTKGRYWGLVLEGWTDFNRIKSEQMSEMIDLYGTNTDTGNTTSK